MGIQINGQTDIISATDGSLTVQGADLPSVTNLNASGIITASSFSGNLTGNATGLSGTPNVTVGVITASSAIISGNVSIAGTLTYEDVTNIDSVGLITARSGVRITTGGLVVTSGVSTFTDGPVLIGSGTSTGTASQRLQVTGGAYVSGNLGIGTTSPVAGLTVAKQGTVLSGTSNIFGFSINPQSNGYVYLDAVNSGSFNTSLSLRTYNNGTYTQVIQSISGNETTFEIAGTERMRIDSSGTLTVKGAGTAGVNAAVSFNGSAPINSLVMDSSGRVTKPYQPSFRVYYPSGAASTIITFSATEHNIGNHMNAATGVFTAPIAGRYLFTFAILTGNPMGSYIRINFCKNSTNSDSTLGDTLADGLTFYGSPSMSMIFNLAVNDTIRLRVESSPIYGASYGSFSGMLLG